LERKEKIELIYKLKGVFLPFYHTHKCAGSKDRDAQLKNAKALTV